MVHIVDRRLGPGGKNMQNRRRFMERNRRAIREAARERLRGGDIKELAGDSPKKLRPRLGRSTHEPRFRHSGKGGSVEHVLPGNKEFLPGDRVPHPEGGGGTGSKGAPDGEGEHDFSIEVSQKEFLDIIFEGMELPDLVKKVLTGEEKFEKHRAGFANEGPPNRRDLVRSLKNAKVRRRVFRAPAKKQELCELEKERDGLAHTLSSAKDADESEHIRGKLEDIERKIETLKQQIRAIPFFDESDMRYRRYENVPKPVTKAVMFCIRDASGSMTKWKTETAVLFMLLLYLFLVRKYQKVEIIYILHTHTAKEVGSEEFLHSRETGGTIVSTALVLMHKIIARFQLAEWNIYGCQVSDGENWNEDLLVARDTLAEEILPLVQYFAYIEISQEQGLMSVASPDSDLWRRYKEILNANPNFAMAKIKDSSDIYPTLRQLFAPRMKRRRQ